MCLCRRYRLMAICIEHLFEPSPHLGIGRALRLAVKIAVDFGFGLVRERHPVGGLALDEAVSPMTQTPVTNVLTILARAINRTAHSSCASLAQGFSRQEKPCLVRAVYKHGLTGLSLPFGSLMPNPPPPRSKPLHPAAKARW